MVNTDIAAYYAERASTYDEVYHRSERQQDLLVLQQLVQELVAGHSVLELACGTGFWTACMAVTAESIFATDINSAMLSLAQARNLPSHVELAVQDLYTLSTTQRFTACFLGFWWSHVRRQEQTAFIGLLREKLGKDILLVMLDNSYVEERSTPIARTDEAGNTYQFRYLPNGNRYEIIKNFPTDSNLRKKLSPLTRQLRILRLEYYWLLHCYLK